MNDVIGFIRVILPRYTEAGQRKAMDAHSIDRVITEGAKVIRRFNGSRADLLRMVRDGTVVAVQHLHLLADPKAKRKRGGTRADLWKALDHIERNGGAVWELYSGLRTDTKEGRDAMTRAAVETLARGRHKTHGGDKRGRPAKTFTEAQWAKAEAAWNSRKLKTWAAVKEKLPEGMTLKRAWAKFGPRNTEEA
jgi:hypothetical protein